MKTIASALAATMLLATPISVPSSALAGFAAGNLSQAASQIETPAVQEVRERYVRERRRGVRYERRVRQERRVRHERRPVRRCIRRGYCPITYVLVPVYYYVPVYYSFPVWYYY